MYIKVTHAGNAKWIKTKNLISVEATKDIDKNKHEINSIVTLKHGKQISCSEEPVDIMQQINMFDRVCRY